ncbi:MAG: adenosylcobinamide-GDP ribazoletransferase, partial [Chloroflexaceae bacterium]|nr:adenosylcobinamide-GDP ribazoletransferase [Chloroflexaceae bacterium]
LRREGMGAIHKQTLRSPQDLLGGLGILLGLGALQYQWEGRAWQLLGLIAGNAAIALLTGWYLARRLGGQTGDTYGAVVEWTEALSLCCFATLW